MKEKQKMDKECKTCKHWKVLNQKFIVDGQPVKSCACGEISEYCFDYDLKSEKT